MRSKKKGPKLHHLGLYVSEELYAKAKRLADAQDRSVSSLVRRLLVDAPEPESEVQIAS